MLWLLSLKYIRILPFSLKNNIMTISCLVVTSNSDRPETHLFIGLHKAGIDIVVLCPDTAPYRNLLVDAGVPVHDLQLTQRFDKKGITIIREHLKRKKFDIVHAFNNNTVSNSLIATKDYKCKFIAYRGIEANVSYYDPMSWTTYLHPRVDVIVCVADAIRRYFWNMKILGIAAPVKKAQTIYKGHDLSWYSDTAISLQEFDVPEDALTIGCIVNDRPRKGLKYLIAATELLAKNLPIHFVFIGDVKNKELLASIEQSHYSKNIHLLGVQKKAAAIIKSCDICILPAIKREGLPKGIIEGMIQNVAPIVTDSGGSPELIEHGKSGLIVRSGSAQDISDAIERLFNDRELLASMKANAKARIVNDFHTSKTVEQHIDLYKKLIGAQ
jgi:glycosyltransferase involved in cell wall biosynthesis